MSIHNIYALNAKAPMFVKETLLKLNSYYVPHIWIAGDFNAPYHKWTGYADKN